MWQMDGSKVTSLLSKRVSLISKRRSSSRMTGSGEQPKQMQEKELHHTEKPESLKTVFSRVVSVLKAGFSELVRNMRGIWNLVRVNMVQRVNRTGYILSRRELCGGQGQLIQSRGYCILVSSPIHSLDQLYLKTPISGVRSMLMKSRRSG